VRSVLSLKFFFFNQFQKSIIWGVKNFRTTGSVIRTGGIQLRTTQTTENINAFRQAFLKSPKRSTRKHTAAFLLSDRFVW